MASLRISGTPEECAELVTRLRTVTRVVSAREPRASRDGGELVTQYVETREDMSPSAATQPG